MATSPPVSTCCGEGARSDHHSYIKFVKMHPVSWGHWLAHWEHCWFPLDTPRNAWPDPSHFTLGLNKISASTILRRKKVARMVDWVPKKNHRGYRSIQIEPTTSKSQPSLEKPTSRIEKASHKYPPLSIDIDKSVEAFWTEELDIPQKKRVSSTTGHYLMVFDTSLSLSAPTLKNSLLGFPPTCTAFSLLKVSQPQQSVRAAWPLHSSGGVQTASLALYSAISAATSPTSGSPSIGSKSGQEHTFCHHGCRRSG